MPQPCSSEWKQLHAKQQRSAMNYFWRLQLTTVHLSDSLSNRFWVCCKVLFKSSCTFALATCKSTLQTFMHLYAN